MKQAHPLPDIPITCECNYIAVFLTMACPYSCSYCINHFESLNKKRQHLCADDWIRGLSRITGLCRRAGVKRANIAFLSDQTPPIRHE